MAMVWVRLVIRLDLPLFRGVFGSGFDLIQIWSGFGFWIPQPSPCRLWPFYNKSPRHNGRSFIGHLWPFYNKSLCCLDHNEPDHCLAFYWSQYVMICIILIHTWFVRTVENLIILNCDQNFHNWILRLQIHWKLVMGPSYQLLIILFLKTFSLLNWKKIVVFMWAIHKYEISHPNLVNRD